MDELPFWERVKITQNCALCLMENHEIPLNISQGAIDFFELKLVKFHNIYIPQCSLSFFEYFFSVLEDNPGVNSKNVVLLIKQISEESEKIPDINRPRNESELESKIKKLSGWFLAKTLAEISIADLEKKEISDRNFLKFLVLVGVEFQMLIKEIGKSYLYDVHKKIPNQYLTKKLHHSKEKEKRYIRTYLCLRCEQVFFSTSNNANYCSVCARIVRMEKQKERRLKENRPTYCLHCRKELPKSKTKPKKYCNDGCRYAMRKKK